MEAIKSPEVVFAYFKAAFCLNRANLILYGPMIVLVLGRMVMTAIFGFMAYKWLGSSRWESLLQLGGGWPDVLPLLRQAGGVALAGLMLWLLFSRLIEAGLFTMFKNVVETEQVRPGSFGRGVSSFFIPFVAGELLVMVGMLALLPLRLLVGAFTLTVGFAATSVALGTLLMLWKVVLVWEGKGLWVAFRDSISFAWHNFLPLLLIYIVRAALISVPVFPVPILTFPLHIPGGVPDLLFLSTVRIAVAVAAAYLTLAMAVTGLIRMVFEVFFGLTLFIIWQNRDREGEKV